MNFTFSEWATIKHCLELACNNYDKQIKESPYSEKEASLYQIFTRQKAETQALIDKIENSII